MLEWYTWAELALALVTLAVAWRLPRAKWWIFAGLASFVSTWWWWSLGLPYPQAWGGATNLAIIFAIVYFFGLRKWELRVANCFQAMVVLDFVWLGFLAAGYQPSRYVGNTLLEIANVAALLIILWTGLREVHHVDLADYLPRAWRPAFHRFGDHLKSPRKHAPAARR